MAVGMEMGRVKNCSQLGAGKMSGSREEPNYHIDELNTTNAEPERILHRMDCVAAQVKLAFRELKIETKLFPSGDQYQDGEW